MPGPGVQGDDINRSGASNIAYEDFTTLGVLDDIGSELRDQYRQFPECCVVEMSQIRDLNRGPSSFSDLRCIFDGYEYLVVHPISSV